MPLLRGRALGPQLFRLSEAIAFADVPGVQFNDECAFTRFGPQGGDALAQASLGVFIFAGAAALFLRSAWRPGPACCAARSLRSSVPTPRPPRPPASWSPTTRRLPARKA